MADTPSIVLGAPRETFAGENRVAVVPAVVQPLAKSGVNVWVERGAGEAAGYRDAEYEQKGARLASREEIFANAQIIGMNEEGTGAQVLLTPATGPEDSETEVLLTALRDGQEQIRRAAMISRTTAPVSL